MKKRSFYIQTLGCKVNQYESQVIRERFLKNGYAEAVVVGEADIHVVNTCTVTSASDSQSLRLIRSAIKRKNKCVIATGCMIEDIDLNLSRLSGARFIIKNKDKYNIPEIIGGMRESKDILTPRETFGINGFKGHTRAFIKIQDGCDQICSYCKVRLVRGRSRSRPLKEILDECRALIKNDSKELVLTGICLGAYGKDISKDLNLCKLIEEICKIDGNWRLRLSSIEPKDINKDLIRHFQIQEKLCKHAHIPFQSGDDYILKRMDRPYKRSVYLDIVRRLRDAVPGIAISTDIMVGFPGETDKRFRNTLGFIKEAQPMRIHIFPFSKRKGTRAYNYEDNITSAIKKERKDGLLYLSRKLSGEFVNKFVDKAVEVLVEDKRSSEGSLVGYTDRYIKVYIDGSSILKGQLVNCRLTLTNEKVCGIIPSYSI